jgi:ABC-2 type transport system ATP-binding protein
MENMDILKVENLTKTFNGLVAVDHINFSVKKGEIFGFLGPNGAGKTTAISMFCTLLKPTSGSAFVAGHSCTKEPDEVRKKIGLVFQDSSLDDQLTARENLYLHGLLYGIPRKELNQRIENVLELVELSDKANNVVKTFSGGMKRRLEIARGLIHYPEVLFLDEPTIGLDPQTRKHIWDYIIKLKKEQKMTIFLTTHYMEEAEGLCDKIAIIDHGKIISLDTPKKLKDSIGGDSIILYTANTKKLSSLFPKSTEYENKVIITVKNAGKEVQDVLIKVRENNIEVSEVEIHKPSINDVFLTLTGRTIREEDASFAEQLKNRRWPRR